MHENHLGIPPQVMLRWLKTLRENRPFPLRYNAVPVEWQNKADSNRDTESTLIKHQCSTRTLIYLAGFVGLKCRIVAILESSSCGRVKIVDWAPFKRHGYDVDGLKRPLNKDLHVRWAQIRNSYGIKKQKCRLSCVKIIYIWKYIYFAADTEIWLHLKEKYYWN